MREDHGLHLLYLIEKPYNVALAADYGIASNAENGIYHSFEVANCVWFSVSL